MRSTLGALLLLAACASSPPTQFYALTPTEGAQPVPGRGTSGFEHPVHVSAVHVPAALDRLQLVREGGGGRIEIATHERWDAPLDEMLRNVLTQDLLRRLPPGSVVLPQQPAPPDTREIVLDILHFAPDASGRVLLSGGWSLLAGGSEAPIASRRVQLTDDTPSSGYGDQAAAMSRVLGRLADQIVAELAGVHPAAAGGGPGAG